MKKINLNFFKILIAIILAVAALTYVGHLIQQSANTPAFASMGSTGGGGGGGGGGSSSGSGDGGDLLAFLPEPLHTIISWGVILGVFGFYFFDRFHLLFKYRTGYLLFWRHGARSKIFAPNQTIADFENSLQYLNLKWQNIADDSAFSKQKEVYTKAQYLYSQLLRERFVDPSYDLKPLKKYLDNSYYATMVKEIKLKVSEGTVDDTIVSQVKVTQKIAVNSRIMILKLDVVGQDKEVQFNKGFADSFTRAKWSDYVVYGLDTHNQYKILNLIYGEHFHLNGEDFNDQASLNGDNYEEKKV